MMKLLWTSTPQQHFFMLATALPPCFYLAVTVPFDGKNASNRFSKISLQALSLLVCA
jgi:hypothetical protein